MNRFIIQQTLENLIKQFDGKIPNNVIKNFFNNDPSKPKELFSKLMCRYYLQGAQQKKIIENVNFLAQVIKNKNL